MRMNVSMRALVLIFNTIPSLIKCLVSFVSLAHDNDEITCDDKCDDEFEIRRRIQGFLKGSSCIKV